MGGKTRLAPDLLIVMDVNNRPKDQWYIEPFVGGCNVIDKVVGKRIGIDSNKYLIAMWKALQEGWEPPSVVSEIEYKGIMQNKESVVPELVGFVGTNASFGGIWFSGYARQDSPRNFIGQGRKTVLKQIQTMKDVKFHCLDSLQVSKFPDESVIYCDPPYQGTTSYQNSFDHEDFWRWCNKLVERGHQVFVSEKEAPSDWEICFEKLTNNDLNSRIQKERLFTK